MKVVKRSGKITEMLFDKVTTRLQKLCTMKPALTIQADKVAQKTVTSMYDGISTEEIDTLSAEVAIGMITEDPEYEMLATRIVVSNMQKTSPKCFSDAMINLHTNGIVSDYFMKCLKLEMDSWIDHQRDYTFGYFGIKTLQRSYLNVGETPQYMFMRVALGIHGDDYTRVKETYDLMSQKFFTHATPTLFNAGTNHPQMSSCFLVAMKDDSVEGIFETLKECAHISKWSGGIGIHCSNIRANGTTIKGTNGKSDGIVPMLRVFNNTARYINQGGGKRKGSFAFYLEPWHSDVMDFLELRLNQGDEEMRCRDLFTAMWIPDLFMQKVQDDEDWHLMCPHESPGLPDVHNEEFNELYQSYVAQGRYKKKVRARDVWDAVLKSQIETGTPYMCYKDAANRKTNQKNIGTIKSSNLCVAPETMILTKNGYQKISDLVGQVVYVWNGEEWSTVTISRTSDKSRLVRVNFSDGTFLECTEYHKFHLQVGYGSKTEIKPTTNLVPGDRLIKWTPPEPIEFTDPEDFSYPYTHGFFCGDGTYHSTYAGFKTIPAVALYGEKKKLVEHLNIRTMSGNEDASGRLNVQLPYDLPNKFKVPLRGTVKTRLDWFAGLCDADGHTQGCPGNPTQKSISVASIHLSFLRDIQLMLHTLGLSSVIGLVHEAGETELPDGKGCKKMFETQTCWRLVVSALGVEALINAGFVTHRLDMSDFTPVTRDVRQYVRVVSIEDNGRVDATYCFNELKRHMGIFNGVITGNCTEIMEVSTPDETAVCNLASICLPTFVRVDSPSFDFAKLCEVTGVVTRNLNRVIDRNYYPTEAARKSNMRHRPIAIGVQGLADVFMMLGMSFDEPKARALNKQIFECIYHSALFESCELAKEDGPYETFAGSPASQGILQFDMWDIKPDPPFDALKESIKTHGLRNSLLVAPMPTASTAQIMGNNEAFEPYTTNIYLRRTLAGEFVMINKHLVRDLQKLNMWNSVMKTDIIRHGGSVQQLDVPDTLKAIYRTAWEISQKSILDMAADRGAYIDQSQSLNIFMENPTVAKLSSMHMYGWKKGLKTGMYYLRTRAKAKPQQVTVPVTPTKEQILACSLENPEACEMCSG
jgi:ribonucleoside-diphosphate reductase alpha chain